MKETICSEEPAHSVSGAEALILKHNEHKAEIEARDNSVVQVTKAGRKLIQQNHYASAEVQPHFQLTNICFIRISQTSIDIVNVYIHCMYNHVYAYQIYYRRAHTML